LLISLPLASAAPRIHLVVPSYDYTPGQAEATLGTGVSNNKTIVGIYVFHGQNLGYLITPDHQFGPSIAVPGAIYTLANGVNNAGVVCGAFFMDAAEHGFFFDGSTYTPFDMPGAVHTIVTGENDAGDFVGFAINEDSSVTRSSASAVSSLLLRYREPATCMPKRSIISGKSPATTAAVGWNTDFSATRTAL
jgi:hypothetical protein